MASKKKKDDVINTETDQIVEKSVDNETKKHIIKAKPVEPKAKFPIGSIVFIAKDADADLNGFKLFPQYKKYTYTVEAYDAQNGVYTLRRLNLSLKLKEDEILAPREKEGNPLIQNQY